MFGVKGRPSVTVPRKKPVLKGPVAQRLDEWSPSLLKSRLYGQILVDIIIGQLAPGKRRDEQELTQRYDGGRAGVREALARLGREGLVQRGAGVGPIVAPLDLIAAREAFEARPLIEGGCARRAAVNATASEIAA